MASFELNKSPQGHVIVSTQMETGEHLLVDVPKMILEWKHVTRSVQIKNANTKEMETKVILNDVSGTALPGELVVIMGPSGAGKSSLLVVISGRQRDFKGSVYVNGSKWNKSTNKKASYVMQDDIFYSTLTVREHLTFQAELQMGKQFNVKQREPRVNYVIEELGLTKCQGTQIGGVRLRGISGDEPASGLDSYMTESVLNQLQALERKGRTMVATIHQPSSELFDLFDRLYLLSDGQPVYNGKASETVEFFSSLGYKCPTYTNPTDYFTRQIIVLDKNSEAADRVKHLIECWRSKVAAMKAKWAIRVKFRLHNTRICPRTPISPDITPILGILLLLPAVPFGGLFLSINDIPDYFVWFACISPVKYAFRGMSRAFWTTVQTIQCDSANEICVAHTGTEVLKYPQLMTEAWDMMLLT
ncbi:ATP-binding Cassette (ABC) Superfamily [Thraustotheca clavata]|uniref:ATP-binding Cassette (ABC) Superfamily n=1 Tax=Thraustotheca clavata TaxID=74557 RepID=A0A1W0A010_9STRA|nr:ATP-binding Cassette (ABC) Superfamily [Thraustotheca clavata]